MSHRQALQYCSPEAPFNFEHGIVGKGSPGKGSEIYNDDIKKNNVRQ